MSRRISAFLRVCVPAGLLCLMAAGCLRAQAKVLPTVPLEVPMAPPRVIEVSEPAAPPIVSIPEEPARTTPSLPRPSPPARTEARPPEPTPAEGPKAEEPRTTSPPLQTTPAQQDAEVERRIRTVLSQATADLNRINRQGLNADGRTQFDTARRFVSQAEDALRARNLTFAVNLAEKAAALAAQLVGR